MCVFSRQIINCFAKPGGINQHQEKELDRPPRSKVLEEQELLVPAVEATSRIRVPDGQFSATEIKRSTVIGVVGHGDPAAICVGIGEESTRVEALVVHERLAMTS